MKKGTLFLGPMAGVTDSSFRMLCKEMGCDVMVTEMVSAKALSYHNANTKTLLSHAPKEEPLYVQLFGSEPEILSDQAEALSPFFAGIDLNMGCPVPKVVGNGEGSALLLQPKLVEQILSAMVKKATVPVTVKIRKGFHEGERQAVEIARIAESCGVSAIAVHGRTRDQYYTGKADWSIIKEVKEAVKIPVIGNGDITDGESAKAMLLETGCDGLMIARAARGNPFIFREIKAFFEGRAVPKPDRAEVKRTVLRHAAMLIEEKGEYVALREMRKHVSWYTTGFRGGARLRQLINEVETYDGLSSLIGEIWGEEER